LIIVTGEIIT